MLGWVCNCFQAQDHPPADHTTGQSTKTQAVEVRNSNVIRKAGRADEKVVDLCPADPPASVSIQTSLY